MEELNSSTVGLDAAVADLFHQYFSLDELYQLSESTMDIHQYFDEAPLTDSFPQIIFNELERILPAYIEFVRKSFDEFGDETYVGPGGLSLVDVATPSLPDLRFPKLPIDDELGTKVFALMQVAAFKAGLPDEHLRYWYLFTHLIVHAAIEDLSEGMGRKN